jgi:hypothetical protein
VKKKPMKKLVKWMAWFSEVLETYQCRDHLSEECRRHLKMNGFYLEGYGISKAVWINRKERIVIKRPYLSSTTLMNHSKGKALRVQTLVGPHGWMVQPLCNTARAGDAHDTIWAILSTIKIDYLGLGDVHNNNVGHYRNKAVIFDW